jgi:hypothetical protein
MAGTALTIRIRVDGARETLAAFRGLPKAANDSLRARTLDLAQMLASRVAAAARADSAQSALMAQTVRAQRDRLPAIVAGGSKRVGSRRVPAFKILFGSEFGSSLLPQYRPHLGRGSYWMFRSVETNHAAISAEWNRVVDDVLHEFGGA